MLTFVLLLPCHFDRVVEFQTEADVQKALRTMDGEMLRGKPVALRLVGVFFSFISSTFH